MKLSLRLLYSELLQAHLQETYVSPPFPLTCHFLRGAVHARDFPPQSLLEIAFAGRSNVGKSSLINALLNRKKLAHISKKPGKTAQINFFNVADHFLLIDMPGYGYAAVSQSTQKLWGTLIPSYFQKRSVLAQTFSLIDSRHPPQKTDLQMIDFLRSQRQPFTLILTKTDKTPAALIEIHTQELRSFLGENPTCPVTPILPFSVRNASSVQALRQHILTLITTS